MIKRTLVAVTFLALVGCSNPTKSEPKEEYSPEETAPVENVARLTWQQLQKYISSVKYTSSSSNDNTLYWTYSSSSYNSRYSSSF